MFLFQGAAGAVQDATQGNGEDQGIAPPEPAEDPIELIVDTLTSWWETAIRSLPNLAVALVVVVVFWFLARLVRRIAKRGLGKTSLALPLQNLVAGATRLAVVAAGLFIALSILGLDRTVASLLAGVGIIGLALGFAFQDMAANLMAGIWLSVRRPFEIGDLIETNDFFGTVEEVTMRSLILRRGAGQKVLIPNREIFESPLVNFSEAGQRRVEVSLGVSYADDLATAKKVALEALEGLPGRLEGREAELFFDEFGGSSINFTVRFWIEFRRQGQFLEARSEAIQRLKAAFDDAGLTIPFPIRTLDFGIVGGESLASQLGGRGAGEAP